MDVRLVSHQNRIPVGSGDLAGIMDALENVAHNLSHLRTGDLALGVQSAIIVAVDIAMLHHSGNGVCGPCAHLVPVREPGEGGRAGSGQADRLRQHHNGLFTSDVFIRSHAAVGVPGEGPHVYRLGDVVIVPAPTGHVCVPGNIRAFVGAEKPVDHRGHLSVGEIAVRVQFVLGRTHHHAVVHRQIGRAHV